MGKVLRELIQYSGIDECYNRDLSNFRQFSIDDIVCIPIQKPDIDQITKVWIDYKITNYELVKTPEGKSYEGQKLTGHKLFIALDILIKVEYITSKCYQSMHSMHDCIPVCVYVALNDDYNECDVIYPSISIEDIYCEHIDSRKFYLNVVLMGIADIC